VMRSSSLVRASEVGYLKIVAPYVGCAGVEQKGREAWVTPDQWSIYDTTDSYAVANPVRVEHLFVMLPRERLAERGVALEGYSPLKGTRLRDRTLAEIAGKYGVTPAQVVLRWHIDIGVIVIPRSARPERIEQNFDLFGFSLTPEEITSLNNL